MRLFRGRQRLEEGLLLFWCLKRIQEYDLAEVEKVVIPTHLDDLVNGLVSALICIMHAIQSIEVRRCSEVQFNSIQFYFTHTEY